MLHRGKVVKGAAASPHFNTLKFRTLVKRVATVIHLLGEPTHAFFGSKFHVINGFKMLQVSLRPCNYENMTVKTAAKQLAQTSYYTLADLMRHKYHYDCWVALCGKVVDLTPLVMKDASELALPIVEAAGTDISHWFDAATGDPKQPTWSEVGVSQGATSLGRFTHVPPPYPCGEWSTKIGSPWWRDNKFTIGKLTRQARKVRIVNVLTQQSMILEVPCEDTIDEIKRRYSRENHHADTYAWTYLARPLQMGKTLEGNGIPDERENIECLGLLAEDSIPTIHLQFRDDLVAA